MKKFALLAVALGFAGAVNAQGLKAIGYDASMPGPGQVTARIGLNSAADIDLGAGFTYTSASSVPNNQKLNLAISAMYLQNVKHYNMLDAYLVGGVLVNKYGPVAGATPPPPAGVAPGDFGLTLFGGLQPEVTVMDHLILSVRFGLSVPLTPDFGIATFGRPISIVNGVNFKLAW